MFYSGNIFVSLSNFHNFVKIIYLTIITHNSADIGHQLKVTPNALVADDALMEHGM